MFQHLSSLDLLGESDKDGVESHRRVMKGARVVGAIWLFVNVRALGFECVVFLYEGMFYIWRQWYGRERKIKY